MKGSISVFVCLILAAVILLNCVLIDTAKVYSLKSGLSARVALSGESLLAGYDSILREHYNLFALNGGKNLKEEFLTYFNVRNMGYNTGGYFINTPKGYLPMDIHNYNVDNVVVEVCDNLADPSVLEKQIYEEMKIRTPLNLGKSILGKLRILSRTDNMSESYLKEAEITSLMNEVTEKIEELKRQVEGVYPGDVACVNGYDKHKRHLSYVLLVSSFVNVIKSESPDTKEFEKAITGMKDALLKIKGQASIYLEYNVNAIAKVNEIEKVQKRARNEIKELETWLEKHSPEDEFEVYYKQVITEKKNALKEKVLNMGNMHLLKPLNSNAGILSRIVGSVDSLVRLLDFPDDLVSVSDLEGNIKNLSDKGIQTNLKVYTGYEGFDGKFAEYDQRKKAEKDIRNLLKEYEAVVIPPEVYRTLPSVVRGIDSASLEGRMLSETESQLALNSLAIVHSIVSLKEDFKSFKEDPLDYLTKGVLIDDYIMTYFGSFVKEMETRPQYLRSEIEYIIAGTSYESTNRLICESLIFSIRFVLNVLHIMCDADKVDLANKIGNAIAGSITCGIGGPLYAVLIVAGWSICESMIDIKDLTEGRRVPFLKRKSEWRFHIDGLPGSILDDELNGSSFFSMDYNDYLRLLLPFVGRETKLLRICDLIELNMTAFLNRRYSINGMYASIKVSITVDVETLISYSLLPNLKKDDYFFEISEVYHGSY